MTKLFELPEMLTLSGDKFDGELSRIRGDDPGNGCSKGCDSGCCDGCFYGSGTGKS